ncbi:hypothetical protein, conserved [Angomonas deanei]|uniref:Peptidase S54 rhomboid domain-containing protein n=1 Tax=Angomonas deanei TaxID=59799 RepID=A0A7G2CCS1_9TRYP|nr:hypothetical protein, conserved [Angomonas deanei]
MSFYNAQVARHYADVMASLTAMVLASDQLCFLLYHHNSYANSPALLRSKKPMVMRDFFLTRSNSFFPNPLSCVYVTSPLDTVVNCVAAFTIVKPVTFLLGWRHTIAVYIGAGFFSSFAYLFSVQMNKNKTVSEYDCACTSNGAFAGVATLSLFMKNAIVPFSKGLASYYFAIPYLLKCTYDEYIGPKFVEHRSKDTIELRNWGFVGGVFFTLVYSTLLLRSRTDFRMARKFYQNINHK